MQKLTDLGDLIRKSVENSPLQIDITHISLD